VVITVKGPKGIGCSVLLTSVIKAIRKHDKRTPINVLTNYPSLFGGYECAVNKKPTAVTVNLENYLALTLHQQVPYKHLYKHLVRLSSSQLGINLNENCPPEIFLTKQEINWATKKISKYKKPVVWLQSKTSSINKDWLDDYWKTLLGKLNDNYEFIDLSKSEFSLRESLAITKVSEAGITLDTFLAHGSAAVGSKNVLVLLGSSRKEVVGYPGQTVVYVKSNCPLQPCGMHNCGFGCKKKDEQLFKGHEKTRCITDDYKCMKAITPELVLSNFFKMTKSQ